MGRQAGIASILLTAVAGCGRSSAPTTGGADTDERPTAVVLFLVDTLRADHLSAYGYERDTSPRLEELASEGLLFEHCLAQSTWTKPTTASILTGRYPAEHGALYVHATIDRTVPTLAEVLAVEGFRTAAFVTNGMVVGGPVGFDRGFEHFVPYFPNDEPRSYVRAGRAVDDALAWVRGVGEEPFLLYVHVMDPHAPYDPPPPFDEAFPAGEGASVDGYSVLAEGVAPEALEQADWDELMSLYDGEIAYVDGELGRLVEGLRELDRYDDALIVFVADHGEEFDDHGGWQHNPRMYQEVLHVPLVVRPPRLPEELRGARHAGLAMQVDVLPTVLDALGVSAPEGLPGTSLLGLVAGGERASPLGFSEVERSGHYKKTVIRGRTKYVRSWSPEVGESLYDLEGDPGETRDLAAGRPADVAELRAALDAYMVGTARGYSLVFRNGGDDQVQALFLLATEVAPVDRASFLFAEEGAADHRRSDTDGPLQWELNVGSGRSRYLTRFQVRTAPGDRDGLSFEPDPAERSLTVAVMIGGEFLAVDRIFLGAAGEHPSEVPFEIDLTHGEELLAPGFEALSTPAGVPHAVHLWKNVGARTAREELPPELLENLRALGYVDQE